MQNPLPLRPLLLTLLFALLGAPAQATLYLCREGETGQVYQSEPCPKGQLLRSIEEEPRVNTVPAPNASAPAKAAPLRRDTEHARKPAPPLGNPAERAFLHEGMDEADVLLKVGAPNVRSTGRAPSGHGRVTRWIYLPASGDADTITTVLMQAGKVVAVERKLAR